MLEKRYAVAEAVLAVFESMYGSWIRGSVESYRNGREHGYGLRPLEFMADVKLAKWKPLTGRKVVNFSECRNSDSIVVYVVENDGGDGRLSDESYKNAMYFSSDGYAAAAEYIWQEAIK